MLTHDKKGSVVVTMKIQRAGQEQRVTMRCHPETCRSRVKARQAQGWALVDPPLFEELPAGPEPEQRVSTEL